jgi:hypothetical protein
MDELEQLKSAINLTEYAASRGYQVDRRKSSRNSIVMRHPTTDDKIVISRAERDGHWIYFSVRDSHDSGSIIDFVQRRDRCSPAEARRELLPWIGTQRPHVPPELYRSSVAPRTVDREGARREYERARLFSESFYLRSRGIRTTTVTDPRFHRALRMGPKGTILFPHRDTAGFAGFEAKGYGWTSFSTGGVKALWLSNAFATDHRLILVESALDALSHHQLHRDVHARYASSAGSMSPHQLEVIGAAVAAMPPSATVVLAFDRDGDGDKLAEQVRATCSLPCERAASPIGKDWNDCLKVRERAFVEAAERSRRAWLSR